MLSLTGLRSSRTASSSDTPAAAVAPAPAATGGGDGGTGQVHFSQATLRRLRLLGAESQPPHAEPGGYTPRLGLTCLVCDDERANRRVNARLLDRLGCRVLLCEDGDEVEGVLHEAAACGQPVDTLLLDIVMRRENGDITCRRLRSESGGEGIAIIAATGNASKGDRDRYLEEDQFDCVLAKPFSLHDLANALVGVRAAATGSSSEEGDDDAAGGDDDGDEERS